MHHSINESMVWFPLPINLTLTDVAEIIIGFYLDHHHHRNSQSLCIKT
ncbi:hypothetical protein ISN45_Aa06g002510 [Arabidopsis thaliana x Arabidopsis arenosa]|uniref:Uncharacterized protein n=1 Tax=Arabidopsis thaliana x Arabidopsis arenosa TaxID=1240361 RepID=A0A8T1YSB2_9BRAS|nr:hypothetical protein ISN45_Aa06g002510 [Arabidopsis thaliana x Arabidopsis arenosa]